VIDRETIHIHDLSEVPENELTMRRPRLLGTRTVLATPLLCNGVPIGAIVIRRLEVHPFTDKQIALLKTSADQAVIAIENVRLFQEIQDKNRQLAVANERLEELDKLKSDFVSNVSHELRTPLTAIKGSANNMLDGLTGPLNEKQIRYLTRIKTNTDRLARLINDILDLSRIETGRVELHPASLHLVPLAKEVAEHLAPVAAPKNISIEVAASDPGITAWADHDKVTQVLMNLIGNAVKFTPPNGKVTVAIERKGEEWVELSVADTGSGIPPEESQRIFDKFYQIAAGTRGTKGTGLGLAISKGLIELHRGQIWVESEVGKGSTFFFTLPAQLSKTDTTPNREVANDA
jgi:signal transduction histidine kinase